MYDGKEEWSTIVGVVADAFTGGLTSEASTPMYYTSELDLFEPVLIVRAAGGADPIVNVRALITQADASLAPPTISKPTWSC